MPFPNRSSLALIAVALRLGPLMFRGSVWAVLMLYLTRYSSVVLRAGGGQQGWRGRQTEV